MTHEKNTFNLTVSTSVRRIFLLLLHKINNRRKKGFEKRYFFVFRDAFTLEQIQTNRERYICVFSLLPSGDVKLEKQQDSLCLASLALTQWSMWQSLTENTSEQRKTKTKARKRLQCMKSLWCGHRLSWLLIEKLSSQRISVCD